jgi:hypothetical protein
MPRHTYEDHRKILSRFVSPVRFPLAPLQPQTRILILAKLAFRHRTFGTSPLLTMTTPAQSSQRRFKVAFLIARCCLAWETMRHFPSTRTGYHFQHIFLACHLLESLCPLFLLCFKDCEIELFRLGSNEWQQRRNDSYNRCSMVAIFAARPSGDLPNGRILHGSFPGPFFFLNISLQSLIT